ncbi:MAG TPA: acyltransferase [Anaerolineaceae bacterium]|nr:acyltransferase [Anaerolineaceae bacterium]HQH85117.1 acyltransferase [Anaerolineaceae bacterium]
MIELGSHVYIAFGCSLLATDSIFIDDEVIFGPYVVIASSNHTRRNDSFRFGPLDMAPIKIYRGCWIATHAVITSGSTVHPGSLVAAGAVVAGDIPASVLAGGVPARVIKPLEDDAI